MSPVSPLAAIACLCIAFTTIHLISRISPAPENHGRFSSIDGLRGYLALFVFLSHSSNWYLYLRTGQWKSEPSNLYVHLGQSSVTLFFMITGFLFYSKLLDQKPIDWLRLYISRILRLGPLYFFALAILALIIGYLSHWQLNSSLVALLKDFCKWASFSILGKPDINGIPDTNLILAGVTWSLPYEWFFYAALPILSLATGKRPSLAYLLLGVISIGYFIFWKPHLILTLPFIGGIAAALLARSESFCSFAKGKPATFIAIMAIVLTVACFPTAHTPVAVALLAVAFCIFACGNTLFNTLTHATSRLLGEITYSIYLLHGILLFTTFKFVVGSDFAIGLSPIGHWMVIGMLTPALIGLCYLTFRFIELPAMRAVSSATNCVREARLQLQAMNIKQQKM